MRLGRHKQTPESPAEQLAELRDVTGDLSLQLAALVKQLKLSAKAGERLVLRARSAEESVQGVGRCDDDRFK